jgi:hypothetical protein
MLRSWNTITLYKKIIIPDSSLEFLGFLCEYREAGPERLEEELVCGKSSRARTSVKLRTELLEPMQ